MIYRVDSLIKMELEESFSFYEDEIELQSNEYFTSEAITSDATHFYKQQQQQALSPPISIASTSLLVKINEDANESDDKFVRRMSQTFDELDCVPIIDINYQQMKVTRFKSEQISVSKISFQVNNKLNSLSKIDKVLQIRANNRRALKKNQQKFELELEIEEFTQNELEEDFTDFNIEVW